MNKPEGESARHRGESAKRRTSQGANKPGGESAREGTSQGAIEPRGEQARGRTSKGAKKPDTVCIGL